ncbi:transglycosylase domain-containing protein [Oenococcus alcoholitolerans]|uniref:transglycosylase domain-containing protein n=1 Tax=Oenococcus alcoholitolerans TaxID=931074 RepID=UPI003F729CAD
MSDNNNNHNNFSNSNYDGRIDNPNQNSQRPANKFNPYDRQDAQRMFPDTNGRRPISFGKRSENHRNDAQRPVPRRQNSSDPDRRYDRQNDYSVNNNDNRFSRNRPADFSSKSNDFANRPASSDQNRRTRGDNIKPTRPRNRKKRPKKGGKWRLAAKIIGWLITAGAVATLAAMILFFTYAAGAPKITESELASENSTQFFDSQGNLIYSLSQQQRDYADQSEIPEKLRHAVVSIEDRRFYHHHGVDFYRTAGALLSNVRSKLTGGQSDGLQGGSTLTQQLVKLSVFSTRSSDQTLKRKAQEAWLALKVERNFSKNQILTFYINKVNMGNNVYGMKTAAQYYFGKKLSDLDNSQTAILASIPRSPVLYDPYVYQDNLRTRRNEVLSGEVSMGYLTRQEADQAMAEPVGQGLIPKDQHVQDSSASHLMVDAYVRSALNEVRRLGYDPTKDGLKIYTGINMNLQRRLYDVLNGQTGVPWQQGIQAAGTVVNPHNGRVVAQVGGRNIQQMFSLNRATQTNRSSGSTAKPLVDYAPAIEDLNWPTYRTVQDTPYRYPGTNISVHDFDGNFMGNMTMRTAIKISRNIPAIRTLVDVGMTRSANFLTGIGIPTKPNDLTLSSAIGINVSTEQEAAAFSAFSNGGTYYAPQYVERIVTQDGVTHNYGSNGTRAMKESTAFMMTDMLKEVPMYNGSAPGAQIPGLYQAGKSGIVGYDEAANQPEGAESDVWYTGFTKFLTASFWVGYDEPNKPGNYIPNASESSMPERAYRDFMSYAAQQGYENSNWTMPDTVQRVTRNGKTEYEVKGASWSNGGLPSIGGGSSSSSSSAIVTPPTPPVAPSISSSSSTNSSQSDSQSSSSSQAESTPPSGGDGDDQSSQSSSSDQQNQN